MGCSSSKVEPATENHHAQDTHHCAKCGIAVTAPAHSTTSVSNKDCNTMVDPRCPKCQEGSVVAKGSSEIGQSNGSGDDRDGNAADAQRSMSPGTVGAVQEIRVDTCDTATPHNSPKVTASQVERRASVEIVVPKQVAWQRPSEAQKCNAAGAKLGDGDEQATTSPHAVVPTVQSPVMCRQESLPISVPNAVCWHRSTAGSHGNAAGPAMDSTSIESKDSAITSSLFLNSALTATERPRMTLYPTVAALS